MRRPEIPEPDMPGDPSSPFPAKRKSWWSESQVRKFAEDAHQWAYDDGYKDGYKFGFSEVEAMYEKG